MSEAPPSIVVTAPGRLHFGMLSFGRADVRQFGGVGAMVSPPRLQLRVRSSARFTTSGPQSERAGEFAERVLGALGVSAPACEITIDEPLTSHAGLGSGTQLALAVAAGLHAFLGLPIPPAEALSTMVGRAGRSAIGTYGFDQGGLLLEGGKSSASEISPLVARKALPEDWRFVLVRPRDGAGLSGQQEQGAFDALPAVPVDVTDRLCRIATEELFPSAQAAEFDDFSRAVYRYSVLAGSCFAAVQGGPFNGPAASALVERMQSLGATGVGQSSWGPTLFALLPSAAEAEAFATRLRSAHEVPLEITIAAPDNTGARIVRSD